MLELRGFLGIYEPSRSHLRRCFAAQLIKITFGFFSMSFHTLPPVLIGFFRATTKLLEDLADARTGFDSSKEFRLSQEMFH